MRTASPRLKALDWALAHARKQLDEIVDTAREAMGDTWTWEMGCAIKDNHGNHVVPVKLTHTIERTSRCCLIPLAATRTTMIAMIHDLVLTLDSDSWAK